ncbi:ribonuclease H [Senna tora]|uniref:Ribonuclease H n=1 Tax=Senna tora TaxID=362788 RepID=A0A834TGN4_9FABA|nr:ribonuclease H [Senna tora]
MNFPQHWQQMLMECVTTHAVRIMVNGDLTDWLLPSAGLSQVDPLSPYLFLLCANVLSNYLLKAQENKSIRGIKICRLALTINHLMYADDILLFFKADKRTYEELGSLLQEFGDMSGLRMSNQKSELKFSPNISLEGKRILTSILKCKSVEHLGKYLAGFIDGPNTERRNASVILDHLEHRLVGWKSKLLSQAARTTLIKAVGFKALRMVSWRRMCSSKEHGGLGFRLTRKLNEALLAKQVWRILTDVQSLVVTENLGWKVGNGRKINLDDPKWVKADYPTTNFVTLNDLMIPGGFWDRDKVYQVYSGHNAHLVMDNVVSHTNAEDKLIWKTSTARDYNVKKAYDWLANNAITHQIQRYNWKNIWNHPLPYKVIFFCWRALNKSLPLRTNLLTNTQRRGLIATAIALCWSIYTQRNNLLFQNGGEDVSERVQRAYNVVDGFREDEDLKEQDYFFNIDDIRRKQKTKVSRTGWPNQYPQITCSWTRNSRTRRKVISLIRKEGEQQKVLCRLVTNFDQDMVLATLRCVRLFLESFDIPHNQDITIGLPSRAAVQQLERSSTVYVKLQTIITDITTICTNRRLCVNFQYSLNTSDGEASN